jgi:hypothetical protein
LKSELDFPHGRFELLLVLLPAFLFRACSRAKAGDLSAQLLVPDIGLLRGPGIVDMDARYHAALPGLPVGAGPLFTFGLAAALGTAGGIVTAPHP